LLPPLREADFEDDFRLADLLLDFRPLLFLPPDDFAPPERPLLFLPRDLALADFPPPNLPPLLLLTRARLRADLLPVAFRPADFPPPLLPPREDLLLADFRLADFPPPEDLPLLFLLRELLLFLLLDNLRERPVARPAAPAACDTARFADSTFLGLVAAFPASAPITPPTTAPTGPATLPTTAPAAAPASAFEIVGILGS